MIGVTIGIGPGWKEASEWAAFRMHRMTGLQCVVLDHDPVGVAHPSWLKCHFLDLYPGEVILSFDADIICMRPWRPSAIFDLMEQRFCAVPEDNIEIVARECVNYELPYPDWYVNGGLLMFGPQHKPVWDAVWARHPRYGSWLEQTAINRALFDLRIEVARLVRSYDTLLHGRPFAWRPGGPVNLHVDSLGGNASPLLDLQRYLDDLEEEQKAPSGAATGGQGTARPPQPLTSAN
jgi:hypothetical protein